MELLRGWLAPWWHKWQAQRKWWLLSLLSFLLWLQKGDLGLGQKEQWDRGGKKKYKEDLSNHQSEPEWEVGRLLCEGCPPSGTVQADFAAQLAGELLKGRSAQFCFGMEATWVIETRKGTSKWAVLFFHGVHHSGASSLGIFIVWPAGQFCLFASQSHGWWHWKLGKGLKRSDKVPPHLNTLTHAHHGSCRRQKEDQCGCGAWGRAMESWPVAGKIKPCTVDCAFIPEA